MIPTDKVLVN